MLQAKGPAVQRLGGKSTQENSENKYNSLWQEQSVTGGVRREIGWGHIMNLDSISRTVGSNIIRFAC